MKCTNCGNIQDSGVFCGQCGNKLTATIAEEVIITEHAATSESIQQTSEHADTAQPNKHVETIKVQSKMYGYYFLRQLKKPSSTLNSLTADFTNALINIAILSVLFCLSFYSFGHGYIEFSTVFTSVLISILVVIVIVILSLFTINHFFGQALTFKEICSLYGGYLTPFITVAALTYLLMIIESYDNGGAFLLVNMFFIIFVLPLYVISLLLQKKYSSIDALYGFLLYILMFSILFYFFSSVVEDTIANDLYSRLFFRY